MFFPYSFLSSTGSQWFNNLRGPERNTLLDLAHAAKTAQSAAIVAGTSAKHARSWARWKLFLPSIGITDNYFLDNFSTQERHHILSTFLATIRNNNFSRVKPGQPSIPIKADSCAATLGHVAQAFMASDRQDPRLAHDGKLTTILWCQLKGYKNLDPSKIPQQALPITILQHINAHAFTHLEQHQPLSSQEHSSLPWGHANIVASKGNEKLNY